MLVVLFAFLRDARAALISFLDDPVVARRRDARAALLRLTLNAMTLGGFAVAVGVLVDDAIIDIENIIRRLRENAALARPLPRLDVVRDASLEIRSPVVFATLAVVALFVPVYFVSGVQGQFIGPLALAFVVGGSRVARRRVDRDARALRAAALAAQRRTRRRGGSARSSGHRPARRFGSASG